MAADSLIPTDPSLGKVPGPAAQEQAKGADFLFHLIDIVNPLQHIPVVSAIYRQITGDEIAPAARLIGGGLFAGPIGLVAAMANIVADGVTGRDFGERTIALFGGQPAEPLLAEAAEPLPAKTQTAATHEVLASENTIANSAPPHLPAGFLATALTKEVAPEPTTLEPELAARGGLADTILNALDKYQAMARERNGLTAKPGDDDDKVSEDQR